MTIPTTAHPSSLHTPSGWRRAAVGGTLIWLSVRLIVAAIAAVVQLMRAGPSLTDRLGARTINAAGSGFFAVLHHWDSNYFTDIALHGYFYPGAPAGIVGFFPGFPLAARAVAAVLVSDPTRADVALAMWLITAASSLAAAMVLWRLAEHLHGARMAAVATSLLLIGPYSIFLAADYSESLFVAFAIAAWYCGIRERWLLAGVFCALASFTRINGIFLIAALIMMYLAAQRRAGNRIFRPAAAWILVAGAGIATYFVWLAVRTGNLLAWNTARADGWGRGLHWPWQAFYQTAGRVLYASTIDRRIGFAFDIIFAGVTIVAVVIWIRRRAWPEAVYAGLTLLALTTSFTFVSLARNSIVLFPLVILLGRVLLAEEFTKVSKMVRILLLAGWCGLFFFNAVMFALGYWVD